MTSRHSPLCLVYFASHTLHLIWFQVQTSHSTTQPHQQMYTLHLFLSLLLSSSLCFLIFYSQLVRLFLFIQRSHHIAHKVLFCHFCSFFIFAIRSLTLALSNIFTPWKSKHSIHIFTNINHLLPLKRWPPLLSFQYRIKISTNTHAHILSSLSLTGNTT